LSGVRTPSFRLSRTIDAGPVPPSWAKRAFRGAPSRSAHSIATPQQPHRFGASSPGFRNKEPRASVLPGCPGRGPSGRRPRSRTWPLFGRARSWMTTRASAGLNAAQGRHDETGGHSRVPRGEAVIVDQVLPDSPIGVPAPEPSASTIKLAVRFRTRLEHFGGPRRPAGPRRSVGHRATNGGVFAQCEVGGTPPMENGPGFCRPFRPAPSGRVPSTCCCF